MQSLRLEAAGRATELARDELAALPAEHQVPDVGAVAAGRQGRAARLRGGLVLYELDGEPLPERFGGPFRLLFPDGDDCSVSVKFLGRIDVLAEPGSHTARCADD